MDKTTEFILKKRMHGLYLSRQCEDIAELSREILGLHCWFHRNVVFSAIIRGAELYDWKNSLIKTWLYRGTLHGVTADDLPTLLALHSGEWRWGELYREIAEKAINLMEDGIYSRAEMRQIFIYDYDQEIIDRALSPWGGVFCELARLGRVAFRNITSRDFDLINAEPTQTAKDVLPDLFRRYIQAYGPAAIEDAAWFFGMQKERKNELTSLDLEEYSRLEYNKKTYYYLENNEDINEIPQITLLSGFDPLIVSYIERSAVLPTEYKKAVIMKSGICLPSIAINGQIAGIWNIKKGIPYVEFFAPQPKKIKNFAVDMVDKILWQSKDEI